MACCFPSNMHEYRFSSHGLRLVIFETVSVSKLEIAATALLSVNLNFHSFIVSMQVKNLYIYSSS